MDAQELLLTALRAVGVYVLVLAVIRLLGKRAIGNFSAFDLLVALMIGEVVDEIIYGAVSFWQGVVPIVVIAVLHEINAWLTYYGHGFERLLEGRPSVIVRDGEVQLQGLRELQMNENDVLAELRLRGVSDLREIRLAAVEVDGKVSVIRQQWAEPLQKADLGGREAQEKEKALSGSQQKSTVPTALEQEG